MIAKPSAAASTNAQNAPPYATSTDSEPTPGTSTGASSADTNDGTFSNVIRSTRPSAHSARTRTSPAGASSTS